MKTLSLILQDQNLLPKIIKKIEISHFHSHVSPVGCYLTFLKIVSLNVFKSTLNFEKNKYYFPINSSDSNQ